MRGKAIFASLAVGGAVSLGLLVDCREPTEITVVIKTDVPCAAWRNATITVGRVGEVESKSPVTSTTDCSGGGDIGTLVVVPSGSTDEEVTIKVVAGEQRDPETCRAPAYGPGCIVARRTVRFIKYAPLRLIVPLRHACNGVLCAVDETCVVGSCKSALITNGGQCSGAGCDESTLSPGDGGVAPPPPVDGGVPADSGVRDTSVPVDTGVDGPRPLGKPPVCGDVGGLQAGAPWPMRGYCPTHQGRSPFVGPQTAGLLWKAAAPAAFSAGATVGADGTVYIGSNDHKLHAFFPDGGVRWAFPVANNINNPSAAIAKNGNLTFVASDTNIYTIHPDGGPHWSVTTGSQMVSSAAIGASGTIFVGGGYYGAASSLGRSLLALNPDDGGIVFATTTAKAVVSSPAIAVDGTVYFGGSDGTLYALDGAGAKKWALAIAGNVRDPVIGDDGTIYVASDVGFHAVNPQGTLLWSRPLLGNAAAIGADGTLYLAAANADGGAGGDLHALRPDGTERWTAPSGTTLLNHAPVVGADGTIYVSSLEGIVSAFDDQGALRWKFTTSGAINGGLALADHVLYVGTEDGFFYAIGP